MTRSIWTCGYSRRKRRRERGKYLAGGGCECVDAQHARGHLLLRSDNVHGLVNVLKRWTDFTDELSSGICQRDTAGRPVKQTHAQLTLELADGVAERGGGNAQLDGRSAKGAFAHDRYHGIQFDQTMAHHCTDYCDVSLRFIPIIVR